LRKFCRESPSLPLSTCRTAGFVSAKINPSDIRAAATSFSELDFEEKKRFLIELLDKNMLYVNLCDLDDEEYAISETDKAFNRSFYQLKEQQ